MADSRGATEGEALRLARELIEWASKPHTLEITPDDNEPDDDFTRVMRSIRENTITVCRALLSRSEKTSTDAAPQVPAQVLPLAGGLESGDKALNVLKAPDNPAPAVAAFTHSASGSTSDTPRTDSADDPTMRMTNRHERVLDVSRQLERELAGANRRAHYEATWHNHYALKEQSRTQSATERIYVHCGEMVESNGRRTWIVSLGRTPDAEPWDCHQVYTDSIEGRARYEADKLKHFLGQGPEPDITKYSVDSRNNER